MSQTELETVELSRPDGELVIYVPRRSNFTRIIVSFTRNQKIWLTSLGWRPEEKSVALKCDNTADGLAVFLPRKYAQEIRPDDVIHISCLELGFKGAMPWGGTLVSGKPDTQTIENASTPEAAPLSYAPKNLQSAGRTKKVLLGGVAAIFVMGVIGIKVLGGGTASTESPVMTVQSDSSDQAESSTAGLVKTEVSDSQRRSEERREAARVVAAEIEAKKDEADQAAAKVIQDEKDAVAAERQAKLDAAKKAKIEERAQKKRAKAKEEADKAKAKLKLEAKALEAKKAKEVVRAAKSRKAVPKVEAKVVSAPEPKDTSNKFTSAQITQLQNDLSFMGYFSGQIDGTLSDNTLSSVTVFKTIFEIPQSTSLDKAFLKQVKKQRQLYEDSVPKVEAEAPAATFEASESAPDTMIDPSVSSSNGFVDDMRTAPPKIDPVSKTAVLDLPDTQFVEKEEVKRKLLKRSDLEYPDRPASRSAFNEVVSVVVSYGIDAEGEPVNVTVLSNSYKGQFSDDFNNAAMKMTKRQRFEPANARQGTFDPGKYKTTVVFKK